MENINTLFTADLILLVLVMQKKLMRKKIRFYWVFGPTFGPVGRAFPFGDAFEEVCGAKKMMMLDGIRWPQVQLLFDCNTFCGGAVIGKLLQPGVEALLVRSLRLSRR